MRHTLRTLVRLLPRITLLCCLALPAIGSATPKQYPIEGTVTALGTQRETNGEIYNTHRTYTVKTPTRVFVLECPNDMTGIHISGPSECGARKRLQLATHSP